MTDIREDERAILTWNELKHHYPESYDDLVDIYVSTGKPQLRIHFFKWLKNVTESRKDIDAFKSRNNSTDKCSDVVQTQLPRRRGRPAAHRK